MTNLTSSPGTVKNWLADALQCFTPAIATGCLLGFAWRETTPPVTGIVALGIFFNLQLKSTSIRKSLMVSSLVGLTGYAIACSWMLETVQFLAGTERMLSIVLAGAAFCFQSMVFVLFSIGWSFVRKFSYGIVSIPALWFLCEQVTPSLFPCHVGHLLADIPVMCQVAELGGEPLVSLLAAVIAMLVPLTIHVIQNRKLENRQQKFGWAILGVHLLLVTMALAWSGSRIAQIQDNMRLSETDGNGTNLFIVQAETEFASSHRRMLKVCQQVEGKVDLIVWPECSIGNYNQALTDFRDDNTVAKNSTGRKVRRSPFPNSFAMLLAGGDSYSQHSIRSDEKQNFVSAFLFDKNTQCVGRHDKIELMPYGEYIPAEDWLPQLRDWFGGTKIISRGDEATPIGKVGQSTVGTVLCCEDMYPRLTRQLAGLNADLLISIGNGMAFKSEIALRQHFRISRLRSIETRRYFVRCASRGVSAVVSPDGNIISEIPCMEDGAMLVRIPNGTTEKTQFVQHGAMPIWIGSLLVIAFSIAPGMVRQPNNELALESARTTKQVTRRSRRHSKKSLRQRAPT